MPRFFVTAENISEGRITVVGDDARHIARSLRMAVGDKITLSDGEANEYECTLVRIRDEECECKIESVGRAKTEPPMDITLFMAYPKGDKLETVVQKAVELGAVKIVPFESSRCIKRPKADKADKQTERLSRIAREAAKQCGRGVLPDVTAPVSFSEMISLAKESEISLFCYEDECARTLKDVICERESVKSISVIVGCEGGFSAEEAAQICSAGITSVTLGARIMRCETAPLYVLAAISYQFEL